MLYNFLLALPLTISIETVVLFLLVIFLKYDEKNFSSQRIFFAGIIASSLTLPYLYFILPEFIFSRYPFIIIGETSVTIVEAIFYMFFFDIRFIRALQLSVVANMTSFGIGLILFKLLNLLLS